MWSGDSCTAEDHAAMNRDIETCARYLASAEVDVICYACTSGSFMGGAGADRGVVERISAASAGTTAIPASTAVVDALSHLGVYRVSVVTPYLDEVNDDLANFLSGAGFVVQSIVGRRHRLNRDIAAETPDRILQFARASAAPGAEALFLSCTNWRALEIVDELESLLGIPIVTSNQALIWKALSGLGVRPGSPGGGRLLASMGADPAERVTA